MASITTDILIDAPADVVWDALRDFGRVHERLVPGFVTQGDVDADGTRLVTFFNGARAREVLIGVDDGTRRIAYSVVDGVLGCTHHNAAAQVFPADGGTSRFVWITDVLPDPAAAFIEPLMQQGTTVIKRTMEGLAVRS